MAGLSAVLAVLPVSALAAWQEDRACNHLEGDVAVAELGTPRGDWCHALQWDSHWLIALLGPVLLVVAVVAMTGPRKSALLLAWVLGAMAALVPMFIVGALRAYTLV